jgi:RNA polymerase sigma factor (sigma-70 family)
MTNRTSESLDVSLSDSSRSRQQESDQALIKRCLEGDPGAWEALLDRYANLIYSIAWRANLPPEDVADVFQSVCLILLQDLESLRDESKLSSWLTTVTLRQCYRVRRRPMASVVSLDQAQEEVAQLTDDRLLPDEVLEQIEREHLVRQALSRMQEPCRRLLTYLFYEKEFWSYEEIARELGLSVSTIGPKRGRCLKKLLRILTELGF